MAGSWASPSLGPLLPPTAGAPLEQPRSAPLAGSRYKRSQPGLCLRCGWASSPTVRRHVMALGPPDLSRLGGFRGRRLPPEASRSHCSKPCKTRQQPPHFAVANFAAAREYPEPVLGRTRLDSVCGAGTGAKHSPRSSKVLAPPRLAVGSISHGLIDAPPLEAGPGLAPPPSPSGPASLRSLICSARRSASFADQVRELSARSGDC